MRLPVSADNNTFYNQRCRHVEQSTWFTRKHCSVAILFSQTPWNNSLFSLLTCTFRVFEFVRRCYLNPHFTYLLTYLLTYYNASPNQVSLRQVHKKTISSRNNESWVRSWILQRWFTCNRSLINPFALESQCSLFRVRLCQILFQFRRVQRSFWLQRT